MNTVLLRVALLAAGILAGAVLGVWLTEVALADAAALWIGYHQAIRAPYTLALPPVGAVALVAAAALVLLRRRARPYRGLLIAAVACLAAGMVITVAGHFPINAMIDTWSPAAPPADWEQVRDRWVLAHVARSVLAVAAFVLLTVVAGAHRPLEGSSPGDGAQGERVSHSLPG